MAKLWEGRTDGNTDTLAEQFNASIGFDRRLYRQDITGSIAHAQMLAHTGILPPDDARAITDGLAQIQEELEAGTLEVDLSCEDIHTFVEQTLTARIGEAGKRLHTARSRNDQVALDLRMYLRGEAAELAELARALCLTLADRAEEYAGTVMPGYTHLQRAQPITFGQQLMAYAMMLRRDMSRLEDCRRRMDESPIGCCALAGTTYPIDRAYEAQLLGFSAVTQNSLDGVSDRDFCLELLSCLATVMMHLSRLSEELILWSSWEFGFIRLPDAYTTGSSIMPQKKNSDMAELIRGKTGRVYGDMVALYTTLKGLPLAYNKDMQEDKECVFDACDTARLSLRVMQGMIAGLTANEGAMRAAAGRGFLNATDLADYLTRKGMPFRDAYKLSGRLVALCIAQDATLDTLPLETYRSFSSLIGPDVYDAIALDACVARRRSAGGTAPECVRAQIQQLRDSLNEK